MSDPESTLETSKDLKISQLTDTVNENKKFFTQMQSMIAQLEDQGDDKDERLNKLENENNILKQKYNTAKFKI